MFKSNLLELVAEVSIVISSLFVDDIPKIDNLPVNEYIEQIPYNDEYDFYQYEITKKKKNEISGINLKKKNEGIYLLQEELNVHLDKNDKVLVLFEKGVEDKIVDVIKMD